MSYLKSIVNDIGLNIMNYPSSPTHCSSYLETFSTIDLTICTRLKFNLFLIGKLYRIFIVVRPFDNFNQTVRNAKGDQSGSCPKLMDGQITSLVLTLTVITHFQTVTIEILF